MNLDFVKVEKSVGKNNKTITIFPNFLVIKNCKDLMVRGGKFYAVIDKNSGFWQTNERVIQEYVDEELKAAAEKAIAENPGYDINVKYMMNFRTKSWIEYKNYVSSLPDCYQQLDDCLCFDGQKVKREDYFSKKLSYPLQKGSYESWDRLVGTLYSPEERQKIEWAIGSVVSGDSKDIQKFVVFYGKPGAGKGTILSIVQKLFAGYYEVFDAKSLSNNSNAFAFEQFRSNPLVAIQMDGDLSRIEDNTKINSLVSHETVVMNEKRKQSYNFTPHCFLFMASNKPVQITDAKSGLLRRLIDINPTGNVIPRREYDQLMNQINFELSGIAWHCLEVYRDLGKNFYNTYNPFEMMERTNMFYNFMEENYDFFILSDSEQDGISAYDAFEKWKTYCGNFGLEYRYMPLPKFKEELKEYFEKFEPRPYVNGVQKRNWYSGFIKRKFVDGSKGKKDIPHKDKTTGLVLDKKKSLLDDMLKDCQAQYGEDDGHGGTKPIKSWVNVETTLSNIDTSKVHFVRLPKNHIVIDFDLKNEKGEKDASLNLEAADKWPRTYAEFSQGGKGVHLHYIYDGDPDELASIYAKDIEIKVYNGKSSLRRRLSACNNIPVRTINGSGLPKKEVTETIDFETVKNERHLMNIIAKCLRKETANPYTAPCMDLIKKTLDDAYASGIKYDIRSMHHAISAFAAKSHHQKDRCMKMVNDLHFCSKHYDEDHIWDGSAAAAIEPKDIQKLEELEKSDKKETTVVETVEARPTPRYLSEDYVFFDIEVFPNLLLVCYKEAGEGKGIISLFNPTRAEINQLLMYKLVGFNCRRYDNHILYAVLQGLSVEAIYKKSQRIINGDKTAFIGEAYNASYTDIYDFAATKQSLKKWEIELGIHHQELGLPWDQPVPQKLWPEVASYCKNDVLATEAVFNHLQGDFKARQILADIAGMTVNDTTNQLTTRIIFGNDPKPQAQFNYPDLAKKFPGYKFENGKSTLNGVEIGEGGRVYAVPGIYHNVVTYDVASMHPSSIIAENGFGRYTERFKQLMDIRVAIKHKDYDKAKKMLDGKLAKYLTDKDQAKALSSALKIAINSVYGLTAAGFDNKFRDPRNKDNWVAKRGALFMETLRLKVQEMGATVVHIKTDSIKIENPTEEVTKFILSYGKEWGYNFEVEDIYEKICLVNDAVYIALRDKKDPGWLEECEKAKKNGKDIPTRWTATGAQFQHPYVFKHLFSHEEIEFRDLCETKTVKSALYLDMNENLTDVSQEEKDLEKVNKRIKSLFKDLGYDRSLTNWLDEQLNEKDHGYHPSVILSPVQYEQITAEINDLVKDKTVLEDIVAKGHNYVFIGKAGSFCPVRIGTGGGILVREQDGKFNAATGSKGYRWREGETLQNADRMDLIDMGYFEKLATEAREAVEKYGPFEEFVSETSVEQKPASSFISVEEEVKEHPPKAEDIPPWYPVCEERKTCAGCKEWDNEKHDCKKYTKF